MRAKGWPRFGLEPVGCDSGHPRNVTAFGSSRTSRGLAWLVSVGRRRLRCGWDLAIGTHHSVVVQVTAVYVRSQPRDGPGSRREREHTGQGHFGHCQMDNGYLSEAADGLAITIVIARTMSAWLAAIGERRLAGPARQSGPVHRPGTGYDLEECVAPFSWCRARAARPAATIGGRRAGASAIPASSVKWIPSGSRIVTPL